MPHRPRDRSVDVCVRKLREKLDQRSATHTYIHTHYGVGYRFDPEELGDAEPAPGEGQLAVATGLHHHKTRPTRLLNPPPADGPLACWAAGPGPVGDHSGGSNMHRSKRLPLAAATVVGCSLAFVAAAGAFPSLPGVSPAQPKSVGVPAPTILSPGLAQIEITRGSQALDGGTAAVPYYGYDGDGPTAAGSPAILPPPSTRSRRTKTEPDKNTYLVLERPDGRRPELRLRHALPVPGPRDGRARLRHPHQPGRRRARTASPLLADHRTSTAQALPDIDGSTWDPFAQRLLFTAEDSARPAASGRPRRTTRRTVDDISRRRSAAAATRASRTTPTATSGSSRTSAARTAPANTARQAAEQLRLPLRAERQADLTAGRQARRRCR